MKKTTMSEFGMRPGKGFAKTLGLIAIIGSGLALALPPGTDDEIRERLTPFGKICLAGEACDGQPGAGAAVAAVASAAGGEGVSGEGVYNQYCFACHMAGVAGAPKFADAAAWAPRIEKGIEALYASTYNGINAMPARGTCMSCSDDDLKATVDYMVAAAQ